MGPRPFGRGRDKANIGKFGHRCASMGPRPFGRGRLVYAEAATTAPKLQWGRDLSVAEGGRAATWPVSVFSFNGAATFRSRKGQRQRRAWQNASCFNGAATFRSRKARPRRHAASGRQRASMGPRPFGRGRSPLRGGTPKVTGALQWGRDLSVAEGAYCDIFLCGHLHASMGPRPFGRGRHLAAIWRYAAIVALQWGRDLSVAEGSSSSSCTDASSCGFNGAATFRSRKADKSRTLVQRFRNASMGPRPFGRGRVFLELLVNPIAEASMGPRPFGRGRFCGTP